MEYGVPMVITSVSFSVGLHLQISVPPSARKDDASPFEPAGGLMEQINASIQRGCSI